MMSYHYTHKEMLRVAMKQVQDDPLAPASDEQCDELRRLAHQHGFNLIFRETMPDTLMGVPTRPRYIASLEDRAGRVYRHVVWPPEKGEARRLARWIREEAKPVETDAFNRRLQAAILSPTDTETWDSKYVDELGGER